MEIDGRVLRVKDNCAAVKFGNISYEAKNAVRRYAG